mmetsp:Transcript_35281/g.70095  ORF Transcript_35281/g.70095 Transcript_35281/m.70095 type:complete len:219 (+) Transcript_35281:361-1017(+)
MGQLRAPRVSSITLRSTRHAQAWRCCLHRHRATASWNVHAAWRIQLSTRGVRATVHHDMRSLATTALPRNRTVNVRSSSAMSPAVGKRPSFAASAFANSISATIAPAPQRPAISPLDPGRSSLKRPALFNTTRQMSDLANKQAKGSGSSQNRASTACASNAAPPSPRRRANGAHISGHCSKHAGAIETRARNSSCSLCAHPADEAPTEAAAARGPAAT